MIGRDKVLAKAKALAKADACAEIRRLFASANITTVFTATIDSWPSDDGRSFAMYVFAIDPKGLQRDYGGSAKIVLTRLCATAFDFKLDADSEAIIASDPYDPVHLLGSLVFGTENYHQLRQEVLL